MPRNILITGGAGFVGSNLAISFRSRFPDSDVLALDNLKRRGSELNLPRLKKNGVRFVHGDVRNPEDLDLGGFRPDLLIECSAEPSVLAGINSSARYSVNTNLMGTINCMEAARRWASDILFLSTSRVYPIEKLNSLKYEENGTRFELAQRQEIRGASGDGITHEFPLDGCRSLYGATKLSSELFLEEYSRLYGLRYAIIRAGVVAGPWQMGKVDQGVFVHWMASHYFRKDLSYFGYGGRGLQVRDLLHIDDLYRLIEEMAGKMDLYNGKVFNAGGGRGVSLSLREATGLCAGITGNRLEIKGVKEERPADVRIYITDLRPIKDFSAWAPQKNAETILKDIFRWINENEDDVKTALF